MLDRQINCMFNLGKGIFRAPHTAPHRRQSRLQSRFVVRCSTLYPVIYITFLGLLTPFGNLFFRISTENGIIWRKGKKVVFWMGKNRQTWLFLLHASSQVSDDFSGCYCFFPDTIDIRHVGDVSFFSDEMCTSQLGIIKELQSFENWLIFLKIKRFGGPNFFHIILCSHSLLLRLDHSGLQSLQQYAWYAVSLRQKAQ